MTDQEIVVANIAELPEIVSDDNKHVHFKAKSNFSHYANANEYLNISRSEAVKNPALRNAISLEDYIERKLRAQYRDDAETVQYGLNTARSKIAGMIAQGIDIKTPKVVEISRCKSNAVQSRHRTSPEKER